MFHFLAVFSADLCEILYDGRAVQSRGPDDTSENIAFRGHKWCSRLMTVLRN